MIILKVPFVVPAALLALVPATGNAVTISGTLAGLEDVAPAAAEPVDILQSPYDFQGGFFDADDAGLFQFDFFNPGAQVAEIVFDFTFLQNDDEAFSDGVTVSFGPQSFSVAEGALVGEILTASLGAGAMESLIIDYGDPIGNLGGLGPVGPDIDLVVNAAPVPLPAGLVLLLSGMGAMGLYGRRKKAQA